MKQVVITGIGAVSPNGLGREAFKTALLNGKSGIWRIASFDPSALDSQIAAEVPLNGRSFSKKEERNLPRVTQLAILASQEALEDAGMTPVEFSEQEKIRSGVLLGTGGGSAEFMEKHYKTYTLSHLTKVLGDGTVAG